jgi:hypothetical protein
VKYAIKPNVECVIIDRKVVESIIHQNNHNTLAFLSKETKAIQIPINGMTKTISIGELFENSKKKFDIICDYLKIAVRD